MICGKFGEPFFRMKVGVAKLRIWSTLLIEGGNNLAWEAIDERGKWKIKVYPLICFHEKLSIPQSCPVSKAFTANGFVCWLLSQYRMKSSCKNLGKEVRSMWGITLQFRSSLPREWPEEIFLICWGGLLWARWVIFSFSWAFVAIHATMFWWRLVQQWYIASLKCLALYSDVILYNNWVELQSNPILGFIFCFFEHRNWRERGLWRKFLGNGEKKWRLFCMWASMTTGNIMTSITASWAARRFRLKKRGSILLGSHLENMKGKI